MNQLLLDLAALKAEVLLDWGQGSYCHCLVGKMAKVTSVPIFHSQQIGDPNRRFEQIGAVLNYAVQPRKAIELWQWGGLLEWNDAPERTQADVVQLIQDTFDRESRR